MKVAFLMSRLINTAPARVLYNIIENFDSDIESFVIALSPGNSPETVKRFEENLPVSVYQLNLSTIKGLFFNANKALNDVMAEIKPDIVHTHALRPDMCAAYFLDRYRTLVTIHNYPDQDYLLTYNKLLGYLMAKFHMHIIKKIDHAVCASKAVSQILNKKYPKLNAGFVQNGVNNNKFCPVDAQAKIALRKKLGLPLDKKIFITAMNITPLKNPLVAIKGFKAFNTDEQCCYYYFGDGSLYDRCRELTADYPYIEFPGRISNIVEYLQAGDYFISASFTESVSMAVLEALACGLPVIVSDIPQQQEILEVNPDAGTTFDPHNSSDLAKALSDMVAGDYTMASKAALDSITSNFSCKIMSAKYQQLYRDIMTKR